MSLPEATEKLRVLYLAFELDSHYWRLGFSTALAQPMRRRCVRAGDMPKLRAEIERTITKLFGSSSPSEIVSCYEAGRDGFWIHRLLTERGHRRGTESIPIRNVVIDPTSLPVTRQARRAKTDSIDLAGLMNSLIRWNEGEPKVWRVVTVPSAADEDMRLLEREAERLQKDRTRESNRLKSLLNLYGIRGSLRKVEELPKLRTADGRALSAPVCDQLVRSLERIDLMRAQTRTLEAERLGRLKRDRSRAGEKVRQLMRLKAIGEVGSAVLVREVLGWKQFKNRKQVASAAGLCPTPYSSGGSHREQGISRAGNRRVRRIANQLAWLWTRLQPESRTTKWFLERFAHAGPRGRKIGITAVARRLLVELWRYLETGRIPEGAQLKPA